MKKELSAKTKRVKNLTRSDINQMYEIFSRYYENHSLQNFESDLMEKNHVILLFDKHDQSLKGFSTLMRIAFRSMPDVIGVYSGDTVIDKDYWGSRVLSIEFLKYLWKIKITSPRKEVYWFLISKGYKTYLLMANNFTTHYPRYEEETPTKYKSLMRNFYGEKFGKYYSAEKDLIIFPGKSCSLQKNIADISQDLLTNKKVDFFQGKNPGWAQGDELTCIAKMTFWMPMKYALKKVFK